MSTIEEQIKEDAQKYQATIESKYNKFKSKLVEIPVRTDIGEAYMKAYRDIHPGPHVIKLNREAIAYLYLQMYEAADRNGKPMNGDLAVGFANYNPEMLPTPEEPTKTDPNWKPEKVNMNTVMLGYWDQNNGPDKGNGILPFSATIAGTTGPVKVEFYDDWSQEWP